jgi:hypothetical protein
MELEVEVELLVLIVLPELLLTESMFLVLLCLWR